MVRFAVHFDFAIELSGRGLLTRQSWRRLKNTVKERDASTCYFCGAYAADGHADHLVPLSRGGTDTLDNLVWTCAACNLAKGDMTVDEWRQEQERKRQEQEAMLALKTEEEQSACIRELAKQGASKRQIALAVYGYDGGAAFRKVSEVIDTVTVDDRGAAVLARHDAGESDTRIAREVFGYGNPHYIQKVRGILAQQTGEGNADGMGR